ncbi:Disease resistance protein RPM1 [Hordeum vulgare]|nr:Disease resistance protein RPM1 [Hordeum vulgare]
MDSIIYKLRELLKVGYNLSMGAKKDLKSLARELRRLQACYSNFPRWMMFHHTEVDELPILFNQMRQLCYDAENLVDLFLAPTECSRRLFEETRGSSNPPHQIQISNIQDITQRAMELFTELSATGEYRLMRRYRQYKRVEELFGIEMPKDALIKRLAQGVDMANEKIKIVSIVGYAGLGKTTLAQVVYDQLKPQFDCGAFVKVPLETGLGGFFTDMLRQLDLENHMNIEEGPKDESQLISQIGQFLQDKSSTQPVMLSMGSDQLRSVKVFGSVDSRGWSEGAIKDISRLTGVTELEVVLYDRPDDKGQNDKLLSAIGKCKNLEYLIIHGDYNPNDELPVPVSPSFTLLERLKVAGRFMKVPRWLAQLSNLKKLVVRVCKLEPDDLKILGSLPGLSTLTLALISIQAMPSLKHLHLQFYSCPDGKFPSGITNLHSLEKIILRYSSNCASSVSFKKAVAILREEATSHVNPIELCVNGNNEVFYAMREEASMDRNMIQPFLNGSKTVFAAMGKRLLRW